MYNVWHDSTVVGTVASKQKGQTETPIRYSMVEDSWVDGCTIKCDGCYSS